METVQTRKTNYMNITYDNAMALATKLLMVAIMYFEPAFDKWMGIMMLVLIDNIFAIRYAIKKDGIAAFKSRRLYNGAARKGAQYTAGLLISVIFDNITGGAIFGVTNAATLVVSSLIAITELKSIDEWMKLTWGFSLVEPIIKKINSKDNETKG